MKASKGAQVDVAHEPGRFISRDISKGEAIDADLDRLIERRDKIRRITEGERLGEELWRESARKAEVARKERIRLECAEFHRAQARRHKTVLASLVERHEQEAERYENMTIYLTSPAGGDAA